jgi:beta-glucosidase
MGLFDGKSQTDLSAKKQVFACSEHLEIDINLTRECITLLENRNNTLPLGTGIKKLAVIGPNADDIQAQFGDWTFFSHPDPNPEAIPLLPVQTVLWGIKELAGNRGIEVVYNKGCDIMRAEDKDIDGAVRCAEESDAVIAVIGDCLAQNGEFRDRADLTLSGAQQELLERLKACGKPLVVVLVNGKPLCIPWVAQNADAVIETFNSGMYAGKAAAEVIFGEVNPSGKLPISFPCFSAQMPVYYNQLPGWHGGRYMDMPSDPSYSFGYGLSYTGYKYSNLRLSKAVCAKDETVNVSVDVTNTGKMDGKEVVQLYINDVVSSVVAKGIQENRT